MKQVTKPGNWYIEGIRSGWIGRYEQELLRFMEEEADGELPEVIRYCAVFSSLFAAAGHTCLPLGQSPREWANHLDIAQPGTDILSDQPLQAEELKGLKWVGSQEEFPFVLDENYLFISKYWYYENIVAHKLTEFILNDSERVLNKRTLENFQRFFPGKEQAAPDWQKAAAALSLFKSFLLISGGPGTGKTTTLAKILALQITVNPGGLKIALAAPTGKAADRMGEALRKGLEEFSLTERQLSRIPSGPKTLHRLLLGYDRKGLLPPPEKKVLPYDLIIVDEASMMDLQLMYRLLTHLKKDARLILLGDKDQLASVEAGAVLADLCQKQKNEFCLQTADVLKKLGMDWVPAKGSPGIGDSIVYLEKSWRFDEHSGIGQLADRIKTNPDPKRENGAWAAQEVQRQTDLFDLSQAPDTEPILDFESYPDLEHHVFQYKKEDLNRLFDWVSARLKKCRDAQPEEMFEIWQDEVWLAVLRNGPFGTLQLNRLTEQHLLNHQVIRPAGGWYRGRPVIVTRNDYSLGVFNGDMGVCIPEKTIDGREYPALCFRKKEGGLRMIPANRLRYLEPAYILTVHKSQGSEFNCVNLLLPKDDTPVLTRELLYTAVTRARRKFVLHGSRQLFQKGINRKTERFTGLKHRL